MSGELAAERWSPVQNVESVLISILSLLDDAETSSPANVDAGVMLRTKPAEYKRMVDHDRELSKKDIPDGFVMPTHQDAFKHTKEEEEYNMSWEDSDAEEDDFGGSDSEMEDIDRGSDEDEDEDDDENGSATS